MISQALQFLRELEENNNRIWFQENKERYEVLRKGYIEYVQTLIDRISLFDPEIAGLEAKDCLFRIYRDIRFSPNKLPYKNYFGAYMASGGRKSPRGGYYFHLQPDGCFFSGGIWCPEPALLKMLRRDIYDQMDEFVAIIENPEFKSVYKELEGETLKRMPAGYPSDTPRGEILLHKDFCVTAPVPDSFFDQPDWIDTAESYFRKLLPFNQFLNYTVDEFQGRV
ncbi:MAG: DUF2461 domain-containing protein [Tannerellaceae bacterium]|nr:DUF2461 domain-containing protein [Tannerellaceae bacterium]